VYNLNLSLPNAGTYFINIAYANGATIYRSNGSVTGYPFGNNIFSITGNNATSATNPADTAAYRSFYYYFYNMQVVSAGCASASRVPVSVINPLITQNGNTLVSNFATNNQWYLNDVLIAGATGQTLAPLQSGNYQLKNTLVTGCTAISPVYTYINANAVTNTATEIRLSAFPVPTSTDLHVTFVAPVAGALTISLINTTGRTVYTSGSSNISAGNYSTGFSVATLPTGTYILKVLLGAKAYTAKIIVER
jgi:hypothetical protein